MGHSCIQLWVAFYKERWPKTKLRIIIAPLDSYLARFFHHMTNVLFHFDIFKKFHCTIAICLLPVVDHSKIQSPKKAFHLFLSHFTHTRTDDHTHTHTHALILTHISQLLKKFWQYLPHQSIKRPKFSQLLFSSKQL